MTAWEWIPSASAAAAFVGLVWRVGRYLGRSERVIAEIQAQQTTNENATKRWQEKAGKDVSDLGDFYYQLDSDIEILFREAGKPRPNHRRRSE